MVEKRGIEPLSTECKSVVFPLNYIPKTGRTNRTRTYDFNLVRVALYQLSYRPKYLEPRDRIELSSDDYKSTVIAIILTGHCITIYWRLCADLNREQMITNHSFYLLKLQSQSGGW